MRIAVQARSATAGRRAGVWCGIDASCAGNCTSCGQDSKQAMPSVPCVLPAQLQTSLQLHSLTWSVLVQACIGAAGCSPVWGLSTQA